MKSPPRAPLTADQTRAITNNLRTFDYAALQYMKAKGVSRVSYYDIVGTTTDMYIRPIEPVAEENYTELTVQADDTEISVATADGNAVTYTDK